MLNGAPVLDPIDSAIEENERLYDGMTREACLRASATTIHINARTLWNGVPPSLKGTMVRIEDLVQEGYVGALDALDKYDPDEGVKFSTYAEFRIRGAMLDYLRSLDPLSRTQRRYARRLLTVTQVLYHRLDRPPTSGEVADALGLNGEEYAALQLKTCRTTFAPLDAPVPSGGRHLTEKLEEPHTFPADVLLMRAEDPLVLRAAIARLPARLRCIVVKYYFLGQKQEEIGDSIGGVTPTRVSQLLTEAYAKLKKLLQEPVSADDVPDETSFLNYGSATDLTVDFRRWVPVVAIPEAIDRFLTFYQIHRIYNSVLLSILVSSLGNPLPRSVLYERFAAAFGEVKMTTTLHCGFKSALRDFERHLPGLIIIEAKATPQGGSEIVAVRLNRNQYQHHLDEMEAVSLPETSDIDRWSDDAALLLSSKKIKKPYARQILSVLRAAQGVTLPRVSFFEILASLNEQTPESVALLKSITYARRRIVQALPGLLEEEFLPSRSDKPVLKAIRMDPELFDRLVSEARET